MDQQQLLGVNIVEELGIESLPDDKKAALLASMVDVIQKRVTARLVEGLSGSDLEEFEKIVSARDAAGLGAFAEARGRNLEAITMEETARLKGELIERSKDIQ